MQRKQEKTPGKKKRDIKAAPGGPFLHTNFQQAGNLLDYLLMSAIKSTGKKFEAVLERTHDRLRWVIARLPFDAAETWGTRGQIRVQGEINGFNFRTTLFPNGQGGHFLIVNKQMQAGGKTAPGLTARFQLTPDTAPRKAAQPPHELLRELAQSKRLLKFYESLGKSRRNYIAGWIAEGKQTETRVRRARQMAERMMETLEAERELPPMMQLAFRQNPLAREKWEQMPASHRRQHLFSIFYYREPESRARRFAKAMEEMLHGREGPRKKTEEWDELE
jgi:uncharacterized protein YdeI (YjbR/CyaY-like superfamily)